MYQSLYNVASPTKIYCLKRQKSVTFRVPLCYRGQLAQCEISGKRVLPSELIRSEISGRYALNKFGLKSSISQITLLEDEAVQSRAGEACTSDEAVNCNWSTFACHPNDISVCELTGLSFNSVFMSQQNPGRLEILIALLNATQINADRTDLWPDIGKMLAATTGGKVNIEAALISPDSKYLAVCGQNKIYLGFRTLYVGGLYSLAENRVTGRIAVGRRRDGAWLKS